MFTFGREHERKCAVAYVRRSDQAALILAVVDAVHDLLESKTGPEELASAVRAAFTEGGSGVWENAASWLRKSVSSYPELGQLWLELARHPKSEVRFRVACCLDDVPLPLQLEIAGLLLADKSKKVSGMAHARMNPEAPDSAAEGDAA